MKLKALAVAAALALAACGGNSGDEGGDSLGEAPEAVSARAALMDACLNKAETAAACDCYVGRAASAMTPEQMQVLAQGDSADPEAMGDVARDPDYSKVSLAQVECLANG